MRQQREWVVQQKTPSAKMDELERNKISDLPQMQRWKDLEYKLKMMNIWKEQTKWGIRLLITND